MRDIVWPGGALRLSERTHIMGVVNVTPDSFSDGGMFLDPADAIEHGIRLAEEGADALDVGGESTRPGADPVGADDEIARAVPVIEGLAKSVEVPISIDTTKSAVARAALDAGASIINDVSAGRLDPSILTLAAERDVPVILMHMLGEPRTMQRDPIYDDVVEDVRAFLVSRAQAAADAGVDPGRIVIDPGIGFGKTPQHNLTLLKRLRDLTHPGYPVLLGASRKSFIGLTLDLPVEERLEGTLATTAVGILNGASMVRVHDVRANLRAARIVDAVVRAGDR
ncbi:MAG TPA: dihydropteroate synthase [Actinomycetota bacterium]